MLISRSSEQAYETATSPQQGCRPHGISQKDDKKEVQTLLQKWSQTHASNQYEGDPDAGWHPALAGGLLQTVKGV